MRIVCKHGREAQEREKVACLRSEVERFVTMPPSGDITATADRPPRTSLARALYVGALMSTVVSALAPDSNIPAYIPRR
jgi:hypothetical protein